MMNVPGDEAKAMSLEEYEGRLWHWNEAHNLDDDVEAPDPAFVMPMLEKMAADPRLTN